MTRRSKPEDTNATDAGETDAPIGPVTFLVEGGSEAVAHDEYAEDIRKGIQQWAMKDEHGIDYQHCADDPSGRWIYRKV